MRKMFSIVLASALVLAIAAPAAAATPSSSRNIVAVASAINAKTGIFDTLLTAATCPAFGGAVVDALDGPEVRTLFAPTDSAFAALGLNPQNVCNVPSADLLDILLYHVITSKVTYWDAVKAIGSSVTMANGDQAAITGRWWNLRIDGARVILPNVPASNGVIHVVNAVLTPPAS